MNLQEYIASGALETYALGLGTEAERRETERLLATYPELREELTAIQAGLEIYASVHAVEPPAALRDKVLTAMHASEGAPAAEKEEKPTETVVRSIAPRKSNWTMGLAAAWGLFVLSFGAALFFYTKWQDAEKGYQGLLAEKTQLAQQFEINQARYNVLADLNKTLSAAENKIIRLNGMPAAPEATAVVAWNSKTGEVKLWAQAMPANESDKQYQLWAIVDGKAVDAGVFDVSASEMTMLDMKTFASAQAFAVTLEPRGGSVNPTMSAMMVLGEVKS